MSSLLDGYDIERADFAKLLATVRKIQAATMEELASLEWLAQAIREVGLTPLADGGRAYEGEEEWINGSMQGVIQLPREFARWLQLAAQHRPATYLEIGCANGATATLATAYLQRFNPALQATTIDVFPGFVFYSEIQRLLPLRYLVGKTSYDLAGQRYDAVFIDGDHSFEWAWADFQNVGRAALVCGFHDVQNAGYYEFPMAGVCGVWQLVRRETGGSDVEFVDLFEHPSTEIFGIGVRIQTASAEEGAPRGGG